MLRWRWVTSGWRPRQQERSVVCPCAYPCRTCGRAHPAIVQCIGRTVPRFGRKHQAGGRVRWQAGAPGGGGRWRKAAAGGGGGPSWQRRHHRACHCLLPRKAHTTTPHPVPQRCGRGASSATSGWGSGRAAGHSVSVAAMAVGAPPLPCGRPDQPCVGCQGGPTGTATCVPKCPQACWSHMQASWCDAWTHLAGILVQGGSGMASEPGSGCAGVPLLAC